MLRVDLHHATPGLALALPLPNPLAPGRVLLGRGHVLTNADLAHVAPLGVRSLWVRYPDLDPVVARLEPAAMHLPRHVVQRLADVFVATQVDTCAKLDYPAYAAAMRGMVELAATHDKAAPLITDLAQDVDDDAFRHGAAVAFLSLLLGVRLEAYLVRERRHVKADRAGQVLNLGLGALLHDLGHTRLDDATRARFRDTGDAADPAYREHPALGFAAVRGQIDPSAATVVLHHHQRADGSGFAGADYPVQQGDAVHVYARLAAVADQFDRLRHPPGLPKQPAAFALHALRQPGLRRRFDPVVLDALAEVVPPYPPGSVLRLSDGRCAVAIDHHPNQPCRPVVSVLPAAAGPTPRTMTAGPGGADPPLLDLAACPPTLFVAECNGFKTAEYNFNPTLRDHAA